MKTEKNKFETLTTVELEKKLKTANFLYSLMLGVGVLGLILSAYLSITEDYEISGALIVIAICLIGGTVSNYGELKKIKAELTDRKNENNNSNLL